MKRLMILTVVAMLTASAAGCNSCQQFWRGSSSWFGGRGASCDACCPGAYYGGATYAPNISGAPALGAPAMSGCQSCTGGGGFVDPNAPVLPGSGGFAMPQGSGTIVTPGPATVPAPATVPVQPTQP